MVSTSLGTSIRSAGRVSFLIAWLKPREVIGAITVSSRAGQTAADHCLGDDDPIIFVGLNLARGDGRFPQRSAFSRCFLGDMRGILVSNHRRQRGHQDE